MKHVKKRHGFKGLNGGAMELYVILDPRECQIPLSDEMMNTIFGPPKMIGNDLMLGDYVTFPKKNPIENIKKEMDGSAGDNDSSGDSSESEADNSHAQDGSNTNTERCNETDIDKELEPANYVYIKIEPPEEEEEV